jgi:hypothetical protein
MSPDDFEFLCGDVIRQGEDAEKLLIQQEKIFSILTFPYNLCVL